MNIEERNQLRAEVGLPLLDVEVERARLHAIRLDAAFEQFCRTNRVRFADRWTDVRQGWLSRAGLWAQARRQLRSEFETTIRQ
jgi:hypothetical protein